MWGLDGALHNSWADAAIAYQKEHYPKMKLVADRYGVAESVDDSYKTAQDAMLAHPNLKGILTFGSQGAHWGGAGAQGARQGGQDRAGGSMFADAGQETGQGRGDPGGLHLESAGGGQGDRDGGQDGVGGKPITDGMEIPGLGKVSVDPEKRVIRAIKVLAIDKNTVDELSALGL